MKPKILFALVAMTLLLVGCGRIHPLERPDTQWSCREAEISFSVSADNKITNGVYVNENKKEIAVSVIFGVDNMVYITNADKSEVYIAGIATFKRDYFVIATQVVYGADFAMIGPRLYFYPQK